MVRRILVSIALVTALVQVGTLSPSSAAVGQRSTRYFVNDKCKLVVNAPVFSDEGEIGVLGAIAKLDCDGDRMATPYMVSVTVHIERYRYSDGGETAITRAYRDGAGGIYDFENGAMETCKQSSSDYKYRLIAYSTVISSRGIEYTTGAHSGWSTLPCFAR